MYISIIIIGCTCSDRWCVALLQEEGLHRVGERGGCEASRAHPEPDQVPRAEAEGGRALQHALAARGRAGV